MTMDREQKERQLKRNDRIHLEIGRVLEQYLAALDSRDWEALAALFSKDSVSFYNNDPDELRGGEGVVSFTRRLEQFQATTHLPCHLTVSLINRRTARADSKVVAFLQATEGGPVSIRSVRFSDELVWAQGRWLIRKRRHTPEFQLNVDSVPPILSQ